MRIAKSVFMPLYVAVAVVLTQRSIGRVLDDGDVAWLGAAISVGSLPAFVAAAYATRRWARTSASLPVLAGAVIAGTALALARLPDAGIGPALVGAVGAVGYLVYTRWYSVFGRRPASPLEVGRKIPDLQLWTPDGDAVSTTDLRGTPTVYVFYRGNWCPLCVAQVRELAASYRTLADRGVRVVLISPQPASQTASLAAKFDAPMDFLVDRDHEAATALGIVDRWGLPAGLQALGYDSDTVLPTVVIVDGDGQILFADETDNYRVRPEPATYLRVLDEHASPPPGTVR